MAALPYMQLYVADYLADTAYLDVIESGAYLHLLMNYWQTGKPLPDDDAKLARIARCSEEQWLNVRSTVVGYFVQRDGQLIHNRVERDLAAVHSKIEKASQAGKKSAETRRKNAKKNESVNEKATDVERTLNGRSNERSTTQDTYTDTDKNKRGESPPSKIPPADFSPSELHVKQLRAKRPDLDIPTVTELFRHTEYQYARTDWDAAFYKFALTQRALPKAADEDDAIARWSRGEVPEEYQGLHQ